MEAGLILICEKCGKKLAAADGTNPAVEFKNQLKEKIAAELGKTEARAMTTSCMNICPKDRIALAVARLKPADVDFFTASPSDLGGLCVSLVEALKNRP